MSKTSPGFSFQARFMSTLLSSLSLNSGGSNPATNVLLMTAAGPRLNTPRASQKHAFSTRVSEVLVKAPLCCISPIYSSSFGPHGHATARLSGRNERIDRITGPTLGVLSKSFAHIGLLQFNLVDLGSREAKNTKIVQKLGNRQHRTRDKKWALLLRSILRSSSECVKKRSDDACEKTLPYCGASDAMPKIESVNPTRTSPSADVEPGEPPPAAAPPPRWQRCWGIASSGPSYDNSGPIGVRRQYAAQRTPSSCQTASCRSAAQLA